MDLELVFSRKKGFKNWLAAFISGSDSTAISLRVTRYFVYAVGFSQVKVLPWSKFQKRNQIEARFEFSHNVISEGDLRLLLDMELKKFETGYSLLETLGLFYCLLVERFLKKSVKNPFGKRSSYWSSELICTFLLHANVYKNCKSALPVLDPDTVHSDDLLNVLRSVPKLFVEKAPDSE